MPHAGALRKTQKHARVEARRWQGEGGAGGSGPAALPTSRLQGNAERAYLQNHHHDDDDDGHEDNDDEDDDGDDDDDADVLVAGLLSRQTLSDGPPGADGLRVAC